MKKLLFFLFTLLTLSSFAQTVTGDRVIAKQAVYLKNRWIDSVHNDTTDMFNQRSIMTTDAIRRYVQARIGVTDSTIMASRYWVTTNFYSKANLQTSGQASVHWDNITNAPSFLTSSTLFTLTYNAVVQWNYLTHGPNAKLTLTGNSNLGIQNLPAGQVVYLTLEVHQDATGGRTLSIPASIQVMGGNATYSLSTAGGSVDLLTFYWNGSVLYMNYGKDYKY